MSENEGQNEGQQEKRIEHYRKYATEQIRKKYGACNAVKGKEDVPAYDTLYNALLSRGIYPYKFPIELAVIPYLSPSENAFIIRTNLSLGLYAKPVTLKQTVINAIKKAEELNDIDLANRLRDGLKKLNYDYIIDIDPIPTEYAKELGEELMAMAKVLDVKLTEDHAVKAGLEILTYLNDCGIDAKTAIDYMPFDDIVRISRNYTEIVASFKDVFEKACEMLKSGSYTYADIYDEYQRLSKSSRGEAKNRYEAVASFFESLISGSTARADRTKIKEKALEKAVTKVAESEQPFSPTYACKLAENIVDDKGLTYFIQNFADLALSNSDEMCMAWRDASVVFVCYVFQQLSSMGIPNAYGTAQEFFKSIFTSEPITLSTNLKRDVFTMLKQKADTLKQTYAELKNYLIPADKYISVLQDLMNQYLLASKIVVRKCSR